MVDTGKETLWDRTAINNGNTSGSSTPLERSTSSPGTITRRDTSCGKPNCKCQADPPQLHGPYISWTRKVNNKTVTRLLTEDQLADYQPWLDNNRRLRDLTRQLQALTLDIIDNDDRWDT